MYMYVWLLVELVDCHNLFKCLKDHTYNQNTNNNELQKEALAKTVIAIL